MTCCTSSSVTSTSSQLSSSLGSGLASPLVTHVCCCKRQTVLRIPPEYNKVGRVHTVVLAMRWSSVSSVKNTTRWMWELRIN
jgi:hypothetical protein